MTEPLLKNAQIRREYYQWSWKRDTDKWLITNTNKWNVIKINRGYKAWYKVNSQTAQIFLQTFFFKSLESAEVKFSMTNSRASLFDLLKLHVIASTSDRR